jgi:hypothetical protein
MKQLGLASPGQKSHCPWCTCRLAGLPPPPETEPPPPGGLADSYDLTSPEPARRAADCRQQMLAVAPVMPQPDHNHDTAVPGATHSLKTPGRDSDHRNAVPGAAASAPGEGGVRPKQGTRVCIDGRCGSCIAPPTEEGEDRFAVAFDTRDEGEEPQWEVYNFADYLEQPIIILSGEEPPPDSGMRVVDVLRDEAQLISAFLAGPVHRADGYAVYFGGIVGAAASAPGHSATPVQIPLAVCGTQVQYELTESVHLVDVDSSGESAVAAPPPAVCLCVRAVRVCLCVRVPAITRSRLAPCRWSEGSTQVWEGKLYRHLRQATRRVRIPLPQQRRRGLGSVSHFTRRDLRRR